MNRYIHCFVLVASSLLAATATANANANDFGHCRDRDNCDERCHAAHQALDHRHRAANDRHSSYEPAPCNEWYYEPTTGQVQCRWVQVPIFQPPVFLLRGVR